MKVAEILEKLELKDVNAKDENGNTALHLAIKNKEFTQKEIIEVLKTLLDRGIDPDEKNMYGNTVLELAVACRMKLVVNYLLKCTTNTDSLAHFFIQDELSKFLKLQQSLKQDCSDKLSKIQKIEAKSVSFVEWLISKDINFDCKDENNQSAVHMAIRRNLQHILPVLLKNTKHITFVNHENRTFLHLFFDKNTYFHPNSIDNRLYSNRYAADIINILLRSGLSVDAEDNYECTPVQLAINGPDDLSVIEKVIEQSTKVHHRYASSDTLLQMVLKRFSRRCEWDNDYCLKILRFVIGKGANVSELDDSYGELTPLCYAVLNRNEDLVYFLEENGADFGMITKSRENLLHLLAKSSCTNIDDWEKTLLELCISKGCQVNSKDVNGRTPLHNAVERNNLTFVQELIKHGADVNNKTKNLMTPILIAVERRSLNIIELLGRNGADLRITIHDGKNLFHLLANKFFSEDANEYAGILSDLLVEKGCYVNAKDANGNTPLVLAIYRSNLTIVQKLLQHGAEIEYKSPNGLTPIQIAVGQQVRNSLPIVEALEENGANVSVTTEDGKTLLHLLVKGPSFNSESNKISDDQIAIFNLLVDKGCPVNARDIHGSTPLHEASFCRDVSFVQKLVNLGAEVNSKAMDNMTPLHIAAFTANPDTIEFLQKNGADFNIAMADGRTLMHLLVTSRNCRADSGSLTHFSYYEKDFDQSFDLLMSYGCQMNRKDNFGNTPIHLAVAQANEQVVQMLIQQGADINCRNNRMETTLHLVLNNIKDSFMKNILQLLLEYGVDVNARDSDGQTPLHKIALSNEWQRLHYAMLELLRHGADVNAKNLQNRSVLCCAIDQVYEEHSRTYDGTIYIVENNVAVLLATHSSKLKAANLPWDEKINYWSENFMVTGVNMSSEQYYKVYLEQVEILKSTLIDNHTSLYTWLHMNPMRKCSYINNKELRKIIDSLDRNKQYSEYFDLIWASDYEAKIRKLLLEPAKKAWLELTNIRLPDLCIECIFSLLSNSDLFDIIQKD